MKQIVFLLTSSLFIMLTTSCSKDDESSYSKVETLLNFDVTISSNNSGYSKSKLTIQMKEVPFAGTNNFQLSDIIDPANRVRIIRTITPVSGSVLSIPNILDSSEIKSLHLKWGHKSFNDPDYFMPEPIDLLLMDHQFTDKGLELNFDEVANALLTGIKGFKDNIRFEITGTCLNDLNGKANIKVPVIIESEVISPRFELF